MLRKTLYHTSGITAFKWAVLAAALTVLFCTGRTANAAESTQIPAGIYVGPVNVGGLTKDQAKEKVKEYLVEAGSVTLKMTGANESDVRNVKPADFGLHWTNEEVLNDAFVYGKKGNIVKRYKELKDLEYETKTLDLAVSLDEDKVDSWLMEIAPEYDGGAEDYELHRENGEFVITDGHEGTIMDVDATRKKIMNTISDGWDYEDAEIKLVISVKEPRGSRTSLEQVKDILGTFTTSYKSSGSARSANVANGCRLAQGVTVYPGEEYSVLDHITPFTEENGYQLAGSYLNGQVVDSLGGGICQVSTTLYNAVLLSELNVTERHNHSMIVNYVSPSADAAIAESSDKDFRFVNNTEYPIYIEGYTTGEKKITFNVYGKETRDPGHKVEFESETIEKIEPEGESISANAGLPAGQISVTGAHIGYKAQLWKIVSENGVEVSRDVINKSNYKMTPRTAVVGTATDDPAVADRLAQAIATGSIDQVRAVANAVRDGSPMPEVTGPAPENAEGQPAEQAPQEAAPAPEPAPEPEPVSEPEPEIEYEPVEVD